jgi:hypothetical protein
MEGVNTKLTEFKTKEAIPKTRIRLENKTNSAHRLELIAQSKNKIQSYRLLAISCELSAKIN